ncbi:apoptosis-inducing factor 3-like isoform X2 [Tachypleus tridentatus]|uniref:apoptosis-inducing factor 3-like isoform X2 n=2 Tax=Tachypleus tridentatus TaxID=6853 RepID=UPI003FD6074A
MLKQFYKCTENILDRTGKARYSYIFQKRMGASLSRKKEWSPGGDNSAECSVTSQSKSEQSNDLVEKVVCAVDDLKDGEMKVFELDKDGSVLLVKEGGNFTAVGTKCTHYGAPLVKGVLCKGMIRCPWHGACFNARTGDIEDFPGLDSIPAYKVSIKDGKVSVVASKAELKKNKHVKTFPRKSKEDSRTFVVVGGGGAGQACIETLRQEGFRGRLILVTKEKHTPYDRPKLSKVLNARAEDLLLRNQDWYKDANVEVQYEKEVTAVDGEKKVISSKDGSIISYDSLMIATGGRPRILDVPGKNLEFICQLRTPEEANIISENSKEKKVVIIGNSFIGMEGAAYLAGKAHSVTVVGRTEIPFFPVLGEQVGRCLQKLFQENGIKFVTASGVSQFNGKDGRLCEVVLRDNQCLPADLCILGIGVTPSTDFLKDSGINVNEQGQIIVDKYMQTNKEGIFAAGDIVTFPLSVLENQEVNIGHWQIAHIHGRTAALNMLGKNQELYTVPFFWCMVFGKSIRYAGYGAGFDDVIIDGSLDDLQFVAYYTRATSVVAVATVGRDPVAAQFAAYLYSGKTLTKCEIMKDPKAWLEKVPPGGIY